MNPLIEIQNANTIKDRFGFWPEFGDDEISEIHLNRADASLTVVIKTIQYADKNCQISFKCEYIKTLSIEGFNHQNVISKITFEREDAEHIKILVEPSFGVQIQCSCKEISVVIIDTNEKIL